MRKRFTRKSCTRKRCTSRTDYYQNCGKILRHTWLVLLTQGVHLFIVCVALGVKIVATRPGYKVQRVMSVSTEKSAESLNTKISAGVIDAKTFTQKIPAGFVAVAGLAAFVVFGGWNYIKTASKDSDNADAVRLFLLVAYLALLGIAYSSELLLFE